eukprot:4350130-Pyramimonas_sp.AAC.1
MRQRDRSVQIMRRIHKQVSPTIASSRAYAANSRSSSSHVKAVRDAVSEAFCRAQEVEISKLQPAKHVIVEIAWDEAEVRALVKARSAVVHIATVK